MLDGDAPDADCGYSTVDMLRVSLFVAFHAVTLLVYTFSSPSAGLSSTLHRLSAEYTQMDGYMRVAGNATSWGMFAPDVSRLNSFVRVFVEDDRGSVWDLRHDIYGRRRYPYLLYDRLGKVNRRLLDRRLRPAYAAWVCRDWERTHHGDLPRAVRLVTVSTRIPSPDEAYRRMGYDPMSLDLNQEPAETFECASIPNGRLPSSLRARVQLPGGPGEAFQNVSVRTWRTARQGLTQSPDAVGDAAATSHGEGGNQ
jgi:hypothetical protein